MAYSNSVDFGQTATEIIKDALVLIGGLEDDETPTAAQAQYALRALNRMVKAWSAKPIKVWNWVDGSLPLVPGQSVYTIGLAGDLNIDRPIRIENVRRVVDGVESEIRIASRDEYLAQPSKDSQGKPVYVYYDSQLDLGKLYIWPTPDAADEIRFSYRSYIQDFDQLNDDPYFPAEWLEALVYNLAVRLMPMYEVSGEDALRIERLAAQFLMEAEDNDQDQGSIFLTPECHA